MKLEYRKNLKREEIEKIGARELAEMLETLKETLTLKETPKLKEKVLHIIEVLHKDMFMRRISYNVICGFIRPSEIKRLEGVLKELEEDGLIKKIPHTNEYVLRKFLRKDGRWTLFQERSSGK